MCLAAQDVALPRTVPYLAQTEALCGGAAAAMVMRYWGSAARAEEFASLVDPEQEGIVTTALVADLERRGWQAFPLRGSATDDAVVQQHLGRGRPLIALIEDRPSRYHYVVITAVDGGIVHFHDPAVAPSQTMARAEFNRRWAAANYWMLLLLPGKHTLADGPARESELAARVAGLIQTGRTSEALAAAAEAARANPEDAVAWDALGTTHFVMDRELDALDAWNRAGKPAIDTIQIAGLSRTRFRAAEQLIDLAPGDLLTSPQLIRAQRRLALLPSASATRLGYAPLPDGRVQVDAAIVERSRMPGGVDLAMTAAKAPFSRAVEIAFTNLVGGGERVLGSWRFREGFERLEAAVEAPAPIPIGAVWKLSGFDARERYEIGVARPFRARELRWQRAGFQAADWIASSFGWIAGIGFERWPARGLNSTERKLYLAGRAMFAAGSSFDAHLTAERWLRGAPATRLSGGATVSREALGGRATLAGGAEDVRGDAPTFLFAGAGGGHIRRPHLRAHPLIQDGTINVQHGQIFARRILFGSAEWQRPIARAGLAAIEGAVFTDAARGWQLLDGRASDGQLDIGAGLRIRALGTGSTLRLDVARGLLDGRWAITAGTVVGVERWIF